MNKILSVILIGAAGCLMLSAFSLSEPLHYRLASDPTLKGKGKEAECMGTKAYNLDQSLLWRCHPPPIRCIFPC
jgi:hypothetical protein